jgi:kynureninase
VSAAPLRSRFPILEEETYLASHSLGAVPASAKEALEGYHEAWARQGIGAWEGPWAEAIATFNEQIAGILGAPEGTVAPMLNATRGMAGVASALDPSQGRDKIVMTDLEFTTSYPLWRGFEELGAEIEVVESPDGVRVPAEAIADAVDESTLLVHTCQVYFRSGALQQLEPVVEAAREAGAYSLVDGYQSVGVVPVDVAELGVDFFVGGSHKWLCGGPGAGYLYVREDVAEELDPRLRGWFGLADPFAYEQLEGRGPPAEGARRFLGGTPNVPGLVAAREGLEAIREVGLDRIRQRSLDLTDRILVHADAQDLTVRTPREEARRGGMVCLDFEGAEQATDELAEQGIVVDWRPVCGIRVSPHFYNTEDEIDELFGALARIRG